MPYTDAQKRALFAQGKGHLVRKYHNTGGLIGNSNPNDEAQEILLQYFENGGAVNRRIARHGRVDKASQTYNEGSTKITARDVLEFVPVIGDILAAEEVYQELKKDQPNWTLVGILTAGAAVGLIPGVGDAAAKAIKAGGKALLRGSKEAFNTLKKYNLEIDPSSLGSNLGNIKIVKKPDVPNKDRFVFINKGTEEQALKDTVTGATVQYAGGTKGFSKEYLLENGYLTQKEYDAWVKSKDLDTTNIKGRFPLDHQSLINILKTPKLRDRMTPGELRDMKEFEALWGKQEGSLSQGGIKTIRGTSDVPQHVPQWFADKYPEFSFARPSGTATSKQIARNPLKIKEGSPFKKLDEVAETKPLSKDSAQQISETLDLYSKHFETGNPDIDAVVPYIKRVARKMRSEGVEFFHINEAIQDGFVAAIEAQASFKKGANNSFFTYAHDKIKFSMINRTGINDAEKRALAIQADKTKSEMDKIIGINNEGKVTSAGDLVSSSDISDEFGDFIIPQGKQLSAFLNNIPEKYRRLAQLLIEKQSIKQKPLYKDIDGKTKRIEAVTDREIADDLGLTVPEMKKQRDELGKWMKNNFTKEEFDIYRKSKSHAQPTSKHGPVKTYTAEEAKKMGYNYGGLIVM